METKKSKVFTRKVIALFMAVLMAAASFTGALTAYATKSLNYHDDALYANAVAWVEASSDQTCEALLDTVDDLLSGLNLDLSTLAGGILGTGDHVTFAVAGLSLNGYIDNLDGVIDLLLQVKDLLGNGLVQGMLGDIKNLNTNAIGDLNSYSTAAADVTSKCGKSYRAKLDAKQIIIEVLQFLHDNMNGGNTVLHKFVQGDLSIGSLIEGIIKGDIYSLLQDLIGAPDGWKSDPVYNILKALLVNNLDCYPNKQSALSGSWNFDTQAFETILPYYLNKLSFNITYPNYVNYDEEGFGTTVTDEETGEEKLVTGWANDTSVRRYNEMKDYMDKNGVTFAAAQAHFASTKGWDAKLAYNTEEGYEGNVLVTQYDGKQITVSRSQSVYTIVWNVLPTVWKTALEPTLGLVHVNYNGGEKWEGSVGSNYDNAYFYWAVENLGDWDYTDWTSNYSSANVNAWAADVFDDYGCADAADFLDKVKMVLTYDRQALNQHYNWRDIDSTKLFNEIRFSPLAAAYFNIQTGPLNLYFEQTGTTSINAFINSKIDFSTMRFNSYTGIIDVFNDLAVAAMGDLFPNNANVGEQTGKTTWTHTALTGDYAMTTTGSGKTNAQIVETLMGNAAKVFQFAADATDANILNPYYHTQNGKPAITEANFLDAAIPFAISALKNWNITASIHNEEWDKVKDLEGLAIVGLKEYLGYLFPDRDYEEKGLWTYDQDGFIVAASGKTLFDDAIIPMAADAVGFVMTAAGVPFFTNSTFTKYSAGQKPTNLWDPYSMSFTDAGMGSGINNQFFTYMNYVVVYFGEYYGIADLANLHGQITTSHTVWQNLDVVLNAYLPAIGTLQGRGAGNCSSYQLLWNDIVLGVVNMGDLDANRANPSEYGFSNLLSIIAGILTSSTIKTSSVENAVIFEIVKPLINKLLGSRSSTTRNLINVTESDTTPVDTWLKKANIDTALTNLLANLYEAFSSTTASVGATGSWKALSFILQITNLVPKLRDNTPGGVSATIKDPVQANVGNGYSIVPTNITIRNESWGLNRFYKDSTGTIKEAGRYYANNIESVKVTDSNGNDVTAQFTIGAPSGALAPEAKEVLSVTGSPTTSNQLFTFTVTYNMYRSDVLGGAVSKTYSRLTAKAYMYITSGSATDKKWSEVYGAGTVKGMSDQYVANENSDNGLTSTTVTADDSIVTTPDLLIFGAGNSNNADGYSYRVKNNGSSAKTVGPAYAYPAKGAVIDGTALEDDDTSMAYVALDKDGLVHLVDGTTATAADVISNSGMGTVENEDGSIEAILVDPSEINDTYLPGTPIAGLFLKDNDGGEISQYIASDPENDIVGNDGYEHFAIFEGQGSEMTEGVYNMGLATTVDNGEHFSTITIAVGNIEGNYNEYKSLADGYDNYYSSFTSIAAAFRRAIDLAKSRTVFEGVNIGNLEDALHMEEYIETLKEAAKNPRAVGTDYAAAIHNNVSVPRRGKSNVDYTITTNYERAVDFAQEAEGLLIGTPVMVEKVDPDTGEVVYDEDTGEAVMVQDKDSEGYPLYTYTSNATSIELQEAARLYSVYNASDKVVRRAYIGDLIEAEVPHATGLALANIVATEDAERGVHRFYLSTKGEDEVDNVKSYTIAATGEPRFGKIEGGQLVNDGYPTDLWNCYVDAIGECVVAIANEDTVSNTYDAKSHLIMAENALELADQEDTPTPGEGIPFSGTIKIATDLTGTGAGGVAPGIQILDANNDVVATSASDGTFSFTADPSVGTTFTIHGATTFDRTITISGSETEITDVVIPVIVVNYTGNAADDKVNVSDLGEFYGKMQSSDPLADINGDLRVNVSDLGEFYSFNGITSADVNYGKLAFEA